MDVPSGRSYHPSLISMRYLTRLGTQALCFTILGLTGCSGDDNAAPMGGAGSAGSGGGTRAPAQDEQFPRRLIRTWG